MPSAMIASVSPANELEDPYDTVAAGIRWLRARIQIKLGSDELKDIVAVMQEARDQPVIQPGGGSVRMTREAPAAPGQFDRSDRRPRDVCSALVDGSSWVAVGVAVGVGVGVVKGPHGVGFNATLTEKELRVIRFCLDRALESI